MLCLGFQGPMPRNIYVRVPMPITLHIFAGVVVRWYLFRKTATQKPYANYLSMRIYIYIYKERERERERDVRVARAARELAGGRHVLPSNKRKQTSNKHKQTHQT